MNVTQYLSHQILKKFFESKISAIVINILAWTVFVFVPALVIRLPQHSISDIVVIFSSLILVFYINSLLLFNRFLLKGHVLKYIISVIFLLSIIYVLLSFYFEYSEPNKLENIYNTENSRIADSILKIADENKQISRNELIREIAVAKNQRRITRPQRIMILLLFIVVLSTGVKITLEWMQNEKRQKESDSARLNAELNFLKSQVNPHFLFNTLNSLYSLAYKKSELTHHAIAKLSNILRYMLYETDNATVSLEQEYQYLQDYIHLQKLRLYDNTNITFETHGDMANAQIAPMLLVPFVENSFKHGVDNSSDCFIRIRLEVDQNDLFFKIENSIPPVKYSAASSSSGIGLQNVKRRLKLLYPESHLLSVNEDKNTFCIKLNIRLTGYELHNS